MAKQPTTPKNMVADLAEEIRASEAGYIDQAVEAFKERMRMEYPRLRGYAAEAGTNCIELKVSVFFNFDERWLRLTTIPTFTPAQGSAERKVASSAPDED